AEAPPRRSGAAGKNFRTWQSPRKGYHVCDTPVAAIGRRMRLLAGVAAGMAATVVVRGACTCTSESGNARNSRPRPGPRTSRAAGTAARGLRDPVRCARRSTGHAVHRRLAAGRPATGAERSRVAATARHDHRRRARAARARRRAGHRAHARVPRRGRRRTSAPRHHSGLDPGAGRRALAGDAPEAALTFAQLQDVAAAVTRAYREAGFLVATAYVPAQTIGEDGVVTLEALEGRLGRVLVEGNRRVRSSAIAAPARRLEGRSLHREEVDTALLSMRELPGVDTSVVLQPGEAPGETDMRVTATEEARPYSVSLATSNHGSPMTGRYRAQVGL